MLRASLPLKKVQHTFLKWPQNCLVPVPATEPRYFKVSAVQASHNGASKQTNN
jgi:hypothetical protein